MYLMIYFGISYTSSSDLLGGLILELNDGEREMGKENGIETEIE